MEEIRLIKISDNRITAYQTKKTYINLVKEQWKELRKLHNDTRQEFSVWINKKTKTCSFAPDTNSHNYVQVLVFLN